MKADTAVRLGLAIAAGCTTACALYAILRVFQALTSAEPDPALIIYSEHAGFFWRSLISGYAGGMVAFVTWIVAARDRARVARAVSASVVVAAILVGLQGLFVP